LKPLLMKDIIFRSALPVLVFYLLVFLSPAAVTGAALHHELYVRLQPETHTLFGVDHITYKPAVNRNPLTLRLSPRASILEVTVNGTAAAYQFLEGRLTVPMVPGNGGQARVSVRYSAVFDDPFPEETPVNTESPGYGVTGIVGPQGTFLLPGAGWYPRSRAESSRFDITVDAPENVIAVTAGRSVGTKRQDGRTRSFWRVDRAAEGLSLSAGPYIVTEAASNGIQVATYFFPETQPLSKRYIAATTHYLQLYEGLFGPYPFEKFAVVENFFPTGYGFPSYTVMGGTILRLPFIVNVSLGHEIAHSWWGNGVKVDDASGNWAEGLTTYVADHLFKERESAEAARRHRLQWLRNYAVLVEPERDFPLSQFTARVDPATRVIGYEKSAMVFHMLRKILGEAVFWGALKDLYSEKRFQYASWEDFRAAFERRAGKGPCCTLEGFFSQWILKKGAPNLALENVSREPAGTAWRVSGQVRQTAPAFDMPLKLRIETGAGPVQRTLSLHDLNTDFSILVPGKPSAIHLDPDADVFRRLHPKEIPATVNTLKGAKAVTVVIADGTGKPGMDTADMLVAALGLSRAEVIQENDLHTTETGSRHRVFIGFPRNRDLIPAPPDSLRITPEGAGLGNRIYREATDTFFGVFADPRFPRRIVAVLTPVHPELGPLVARKAAHYGKYSYLVFRKGKNMEKGAWPVTESPLEVRWEQRPGDR